MGNRILLADDSITIQKVVGIIFANEDCDLTVVDNGDSAVEKARETRPDVMLVDAIMPGKTGYEVCAAIRQDPALGTVPILLMTGAFEPFDEEKARQCGADDFISKPFESQQLIDKVKVLLDLGKSRPAAAPVEVPAPAAAAAPAAAPAAPAGFESAEPFAIEFDEPLPVEPQPAVPPPPVSEPVAERVAPPEPQTFVFEVEEASPADDLWGAFELEDEVVGEETVDFGPVAVAESVAGPTVASVSTGLEPTTDVFGFDAEPTLGVVDFGVSTTGDEFVFAEEAEETALVASREPAPFSTPTMEEPFAFGEVSAADVIEPYGTISEAPVSEEFVAAMEPFEAPRGDEFTTPAMEETVFAPMEALAPSPSPFAAAPAPTEAGGTITLTEEQLAAAISRISREVIERIAWEVVPDLAETLIKEEIRRIKEGS